MDSEDKLIVFFLVAFVVFFIGLGIFIFGTVDDDVWTKAPDNCYVHEYNSNRLFGSDTHTITYYCPTKEK